MEFVDLKYNHGTKSKIGVNSGAKWTLVKKSCGRWTVTNQQTVLTEKLSCTEITCWFRWRGFKNLMGLVSRDHAHFVFVGIVFTVILLKYTINQRLLASVSMWRLFSCLQTPFSMWRHITTSWCHIDINCNSMRFTMQKLSISENRPCKSHRCPTDTRNWIISSQY